MMLALNMSNHSAIGQLGNVTNRILLVEDEESIRELLVLGLEEEGYEVVAMADGQAALTQCQQPSLQPQDFPFDLIILDLMLPKVSGLDLCRFLRYQGNHVPILIVSAKTTETDRVLGLEVGADDYISKPFSMRELIARCRALLRRHRLNVVADTPTIHFQDITLYPEEYRVVVRGIGVNLSPRDLCRTPAVFGIANNYSIASGVSILSAIARLSTSTFVGCAKNSKSIPANRNTSPPFAVLVIGLVRFRFG
jgi:two-component system, OmpR family, phosphate regulon response regulator PhoB